MLPRKLDVSKFSAFTSALAVGLRFLSCFIVGVRAFESQKCETCFLSFGWRFWDGGLSNTPGAFLPQVAGPNVGGITGEDGLCQSAPDQQTERDMQEKAVPPAQYQRRRAPGHRRMPDAV